MSEKYSTIQLRLYLIGGVILLSGLSCAAWLYQSATDDINTIGYEIVDGHKYAITPESSKRYQYDLERMGGKSAVLVAELDDWLSSLWHGKRLSYTLAFLSIGIAFAFFSAAQHPSHKLPDHKNNE